MDADYELSVVIPVFNEEKNIGELLKDWQLTLQAIPIRYRFIIINDGSTDNSLPILQSIARQMTSTAEHRQSDTNLQPPITIHTQSNAGHGPSILAGYKLALDTDWVFQIDSDHQHDPAAFAILWENRNKFDFLLGERKEKNATLPRKWISFSSWLIVRLLYGKRIKDVNSPYRLIRSSELKEILTFIPAKAFAPNILLTAWFVYFETRVFTTVISNRSESSQRQSKMNGYFLRGCFQSIFQTILFRFRL
jgi:glycosyltransferase involved in cell wall biosynthesis